MKWIKNFPKKTGNFNTSISETTMIEMGIKKSSRKITTILMVKWEKEFLTIMQCTNTNKTIGWDTSRFLFCLQASLDTIQSFLNQGQNKHWRKINF